MIQVLLWIYGIGFVLTLIFFYFLAMMGSLLDFRELSLLQHLQVISLSLIWFFTIPYALLGGH